LSSRRWSQSGVICPQASPNWAQPLRVIYPGPNFSLGGERREGTHSLHGVRAKLLLLGAPQSVCACGGERARLECTSTLGSPSLGGPLRPGSSSWGSTLTHIKTHPTLKFSLQAMRRRLGREEGTVWPCRGGSARAAPGPHILPLQSPQDLRLLGSP
jgi:hypothetical protein